MKFTLDNTFSSSLPADKSTTNMPRQVESAFFSYVNPTPTAAPKLILASEEVGRFLGLTAEELQSDEFTQVFSGNKNIEGAKPYAMCYGGHQFGHWAGQLGDGRAINLAEITHQKKRWALQLKGAGKTPYSRTADGLAVLRSSIREFLASEAMHKLGVPTTRALSLSLTGEKVLRDILYDGNPAYEPGAVVCRVAESFVRFGSFEIFASRKDEKNLQLLLDYTLKNLYPHIEGSGTEAYLQLFKEVSERTLELILHWERVGFVHGVMNTDNLSILGLTIDYGPYGWLDDYDPNWTPNTTDAQNKRYRYGNQAQIGLWNLVKLANAIYPLVEDAKPFEEILDGYKNGYHTGHLNLMKRKIGLYKTRKGDGLIITNLEELLVKQELDMTIFFRSLTSINTASSFNDFKLVLERSAYVLDDLNKNIFLWENWFHLYTTRINKQSVTLEERTERMNETNPKYILRNYMAQLAIEDAENGNYKLLMEIYSLLKNPYSEQPENEKWFAKRPDWAREKVGCSMLSCSS